MSFSCYIPILKYLTGTRTENQLFYPGPSSNLSRTEHWHGHVSAVIGMSAVSHVILTMLHENNDFYWVNISCLIDSWLCLVDKIGYAKLSF